MCASNVAATISATNGRYRDADVYVTLLPPSPEIATIDITNKD